MTRKPLIAGNWKMHNTIGQTLDLLESLKKKKCDTHKVEVVVAPPFTAIKTAYDALSDTSIQVAGQDVFWEEKGAFTGEVSPIMLKEAGCKWVIVGHSERRQYFGETDETVNKRLKAAAAHGLKVIVCVGETLEQRESGQTFEVLEKQVKGAMSGVDAKAFGGGTVAIAYEPVWAIGTGKTATADQADEAHGRIRGTIEELYGKKAAQAARILYGGSVKPDNAGELLSRENVDGALVGGASLKASDFAGIIMAGVAAAEA